MQFLAHNSMYISLGFSDGGYENSTRVFGSDGWEMQPPLRAAAASVGTDCVLGQPASKCLGWTAEIALPLSELAYNTTASVPPRDGDFWRINFSRVEWHVKVRSQLQAMLRCLKHTQYCVGQCLACMRIANKQFIRLVLQLFQWVSSAIVAAIVAVGGVYVKDPAYASVDPDNWVWSPQRAVNMHAPETWGILQFATGPVNDTNLLSYTHWPLRHIAMEMYHAQAAF
eukprot:scaffold42237_cov41-Prasinocladus_malaysianus.AAC.1